MRRPARPCFPGCQGWRIVVEGDERRVAACEQCWAGDARAPTDRYYEDFEACREAVARMSHSEDEGDESCGYPQATGIFRDPFDCTDEW